MTSPNAELLQRMNTLKDAATDTLLTDAQVQALDTIEDYRSNSEPYINLYGPPDVGKTFLCWILQQDSDWTYYQALPDSPDSPAVIYDHADPERRATRQLRSHATINGLSTVVYVTNRPADEVYPRVELQPSDAHYDTITANWEQLGLNTHAAPTP